MSDKLKKPPVRDISDLKAKLGLAKGPSKQAPGGAVPPPAGVVAPPGAGGVVPPSGVVPPAGGIVPPAGYRPPVQRQPQQQAAPVDEGPMEPIAMHGNKQLILNIAFGVGAVVAFFGGCQCGKMVLIRGWVNKVTTDCQKITKTLKKVNRVVRRMQAIDNTYGLVDKRGRPVKEYSPEFGNKAIKLVSDLANIKEAEVFGIFYNLLEAKDRPVVGRLFIYFAALRRLRYQVVSLRKFEAAQAEMLLVMTKEGGQAVSKEMGKVAFGVYSAGPGQVALTLLDPKNAVCGKKLNEPCGKKAPQGYKINDVSYAFKGGKPEQRLTRVNVGAMGGLAKCMTSNSAIQQRIWFGHAAWSMYRMYRMAITKTLHDIQDQAKPSEIYKVYNRYASRKKVNHYVIF
ncbi:MAG: hypothetical protein J7M25_07140 [Deltaproteobacteria bacterium]|nr:hypothetical protein [Deltaproteobacteria bacterium]